MPSNLKSQEEGVMTLKNSAGSIIGFFYKDTVSHDNIFYRCEKMSFEDLKELFNEDNKI